MPVDTTEKNFEETIESYMVGVGGYKRRPNTDYDRTLCLIPDDVIDFLIATQPGEWQKLERIYKAQAREKFLQRLSSEVSKRGTLDVLRKGVKDAGAKFRLVYFRPASTLNPDIQAKYRANVFTLMRQVKYKEGREYSLDLGVFLNGLPIFTAELKNPFKGQNYRHALYQYRNDRDPREPLFQFGRCLGHFAVDPDEVYVTTHLQGKKTRFLPFNKGRANGAGNPMNLGGFATAYLWEGLWAKDSLLDLLQNFIHVIDVLDDKGEKTGEQRLLFPRYHQLDAVRRLVADTRGQGAGQQYLIQHSAGSGKSYTIAWLAHQLATLHDAQDQRVFDSIIVITDRRVLDWQLQQTVRQFEQTRGIVENIDTTSRQLREALEDGKNIIVTTLQKFPVVYQELQALQVKGKRFAVIVDEAHSGQSGESVKSLKAVLSVGSLEEAAAEDETEPKTLDDYIEESQQLRGRLPHVSMFAFTATPKRRTLELFGTQRPDGSFAPFSLYSMRQAIEEGFILDVLRNYTTYRTYWKLLKKVEDDPRYDRPKAEYLLKRFVDLHDHTIRQKVEIMVSHFVAHVQHQVGGRAKAMIVTRSRLHAVRYRLAVDEYLRAQGHNFRALVAFSGTVHDHGKDYTEANMNGFSDTQTAEMFKRDEYRILIVANKFQTGFDEPLLHTMYVDKKLGGVHAVQTLSRLNRTHPAKEDTMVLDFCNEAEDIEHAFQPYYETTILSKATEPNLLYDLEHQLEEYLFYTPEDVDSYAQVWFRDGTQDQLYSALQPVVDRYRLATEQEQGDFRSKLNDFVRLYAFLSQVMPFADTDLEKLYAFGRLLLRRLPLEPDELPLEVQQNIDLESLRIQEMSVGAIQLERGASVLDPQSEESGRSRRDEELEALSTIIKELNRRFGDIFTEAEEDCIVELEDRITDDERLARSMEVNTPDNARLTFESVLSEHLEDMIGPYFSFYQKVNSHEAAAQMLFDVLFERYLERFRKAG